MSLKKYTQEDFEHFKDIDGEKICPKGDYTEIKKFPYQCSFEGGSRFGAETIFDAWSYFGQNCTFGENCRFGKRCIFENGCYLGEGCVIGRESSLGENCHIENCWVDETCYIKDGRLTPFEELLEFAKEDFEQTCSHDEDLDI